MLRTLILLAGALSCAPTLAQIDRETENNDTESRADGPVGALTVVSASLSSRSDIDWFWFDLAQPGRIDLSLAHGASPDFDFSLYGASGPALLRAATSANPETASLASAAAGRYFVRVNSYRGSGSYRLDAVFGGSSGGGGCGSGPRPARPSNLQNWLTGNAGNAARSAQGGPALLLMGGGAEVDSAFVQRAFPIANGGDVVVLRTSGADGYNDYLFNLASGSFKPDSVETLLVDTRAKADSDYVAWTLCNAELVFMAGGDQSAYLNAWQGTRVQSSIGEAYARGAVVGGLSAGLAVLGAHIYDPDGVSAVTSTEAIADPYRSGMRFSSAFLELPLLAGVITDTHFAERDRMGRLLAFMARLRADGSASGITGIGVDEDTSMFIDRDGRAVVDGSGAAYVLRETADTARVQVSAGQPLVYRRIERTRLRAGQSFDFGSGSHTGSRIELSVDGRSSPVLTPSPPY
jgi:cyanophycinase